MSLRERIEQRLEELDLTPITAATRAGLKRDLIRNVVRGDANSPRADSLVDIARALDTSVAWLVGETAPSTQTETSPEKHQLNRIERKLDALLAHLGVKA